MAEDAARDLPNLPLEDALQLVHVYANHPKYEKAAMRWLEGYLKERELGVNTSPNSPQASPVRASIASASKIAHVWTIRTRSNGRVPSSEIG